MTEPKLDILFEDNHLLVVNKPAGLLTQPSGTQRLSIEELAKAWIKHKYQKPGNVFLESVHRLDKPVSGVVVFGKTSKALSRLNASMRDQLTRKYYYALVEGKMTSPQGVLEHYLVHDEFQAQVFTSPHPQAKLARLSYRIIEVKTGSTLLEIQLETGRYHQIRAQFAAIGHPIIGDEKYGSHVSFKGDGIALHHIRLQIPHPITKEPLLFEAPLPDTFKNYG
jgi:23S rRNA pseudouridine1911/1915/1917 synthase